MKKLLLVLVFILSMEEGWSQSQGISYQAIIIDEKVQEIPGVDITGNYLPNHPLTVRFSIIDATGAVEYQEIQQTTTDAYGMINLMIGTGTPTPESAVIFSEISWDGTPKSLQVDISAGESTTQFKELSLQELTFVPYAYHRNITATGDLTVEGQATFTGPSEFTTLTVESTTDLNGELNVNEGNPANLSGTLNVQGNTNLYNSLAVTGISSLTGQVTVDALVTGGQSSYDAYPLRVQGSDQGIAVRINGGRNAGKNYITFWDQSGIQGNIEGQTLGELHNSFRFIWDVTMAGLNQGFILAEQIACGTQLDLAEAAVMAVEGISAGAQWVELTYDAESNVGISFNSGGADYAEWLEKANPHEIFQSGEIVGVTGGKISRQTSTADHLMVISTNPIVLGNMPKENEQNYEKTAFMGQVPTRVVGKVNVGDYILPSGNNDGAGIAVSPQKMRASDYSNIVGVAWENSASSMVSYVNVAVGINANDLSEKVAHLETEVEELKQQLSQLISALNASPSNTGNNFSTTISTPVADTIPLRQSSLAFQLTNQTPISDTRQAEVEAWLDEYGYIFEVKMNHLKSYFTSKGVQLEQYPEVQRIIEDPVQVLKEMSQGKYMPTLWNSLEERYMRQTTK